MGNAFQPMQRKFFNSLMLGMCEFQFPNEIWAFVCLANRFTNLSILLLQFHTSSTKSVKCFYARNSRCIYSIAFLFDFIKYNTRSSSFKFCLKTFHIFPRNGIPINFQWIGTWHTYHGAYKITCKFNAMNKMLINSNVLFTLHRPFINRWW